MNQSTIFKAKLNWRIIQIFQVIYFTFSYLDDYRSHMASQHKYQSEFFLKKQALDGALKVFCRTLNVGYQPEMLLEEPFIIDVVGLLSNHRNRCPYYKVQGTISFFCYKSNSKLHSLNCFHFLMQEFWPLILKLR